MNNSDHQRSPRYLETTTNLVREGAYLDSTPNGISIPTMTRSPVFPRSDIKSGHIRKTRASPVIWEAKTELEERGLIAFPLRCGCTIPLDIIAWDHCLSYWIVVRRSRDDPDLREITTRFSALITVLRPVPLPLTSRLQLWIYHGSSVRVFEILSGGLMSVSPP